MDISFIIPAYNEEEYLPDTLENISGICSEIQPIQHEIIVVDNNSDDNTAVIANSFNAKVVFKKNNCIAAARNAGAEAATGNLLVFVDADTRISSRLVREAIRLTNEGKICGGGALVGFDRKTIPFSMKIFAELWRSYTRICPLAAGSFLFCLRHAWREVSGFNEHLYAAEEIDFSGKLKKWGRKNKLGFMVINIPVISSARKIDQYSSQRIALTFLLLLLLPFLLRSKLMCSIWYHRQKKAESSQAAEKSIPPIINH